MIESLSNEELAVLGEVLKQYLTELRTEILDTDDHDYKQGLKHKADVIREILSKMERKRVVPVN